MHNYDFNILHYGEFENLTRDLLQAELKIRIESFKDGKDGGIDLRYGLTDGRECIVQVKRYKNWSSLKKTLEKEVEKVRKLKPEPKRYILSTSVELSPDNKKTIQKIFKSYIKDTKDILGREDLNNLLGLHSEIEEQYYKLWIGSTTVLNKILHRRIFNWSESEKRKIQKDVRRYVQNDSFNDALQILDKHRFLLITGIPGIGKTTLARMVVCCKLAKGYEELICAHKIDDAVEMYQEGKKQIFLFDDVWGQASIDKTRLHEESEKLTGFINDIREDKDKLLIMTSRSYLFAQAIEGDEMIHNSNIDIAACELDMSVYNEEIRTLILYNHMADAHLPHEYIEQILANKKYLAIIRHQNFSPRVIESYIDNGGWQGYSASEFVPTFIDWLDNSTTVWKFTFKNLDDFDKYALLVLITLGEQIDEDIWKEAFDTFYDQLPSRLQIVSRDERWKETIETLDGSFIDVYPEQDGGKTILWNNSSVQDYVLSYIKNYKDVRRQIIGGTRYVDQLYSIFTNRRVLVEYVMGYVWVDPEESALIVKRFNEIMQGGAPSYILRIKCDGVFDIAREMEILSFFIGMHRNTGVIERYLSREDFLNNDISAQLRLSLLGDIDYRNVDYTAEEVIESIIDENGLDVGDMVEIIETAARIHRLNLIKDVSFIYRLKAMFKRAIKDSAFNGMKIGIVKSLVRRVARILSSDLFPSDEYMREIATLEEDIAIMQSEDEAELDKTKQKTIDWKRIDDTMSSLLVEES